jgi:hypothetical protein
MTPMNNHVFGSVRNGTCLPLIPTSTVGERHRVRGGGRPQRPSDRRVGECLEEVHLMDVGGCGLVALLLALVVGLGAFVAMPAEVSVDAMAAPVVVEISPSP